MNASDSKGASVPGGRPSPLNVEALKGRQILIVNSRKEGVDALRAAFLECGADIVGPVDEVDGVFELIGGGTSVDGAVIELDGHQNTVLPIVEEMSRRRIPFVFSTLPEGEVERASIDVDRVLTTLVTRLADVGPYPYARDPAVSAQPLFRNKILQLMRPEHYAMLAPHLTRVDLKARETLVDEQQPITSVWFPETAVIAMLVAAEGARPIEVGLIGSEGMTDLVLSAGQLSALRTSVLIPGTALAVDAEIFVAAMAYPGFDRLVLAYKESIAVQFAYAALSHGTSTIDARLARWILMLDDRLEGSTIPVVHNLIADLLAVRRSGVTTALHVLEGMGAIKSLRGVIQVRDRSVLKTLAGSTYGPPEAEYDRVMARVGGPAA